MPSKDKFKRKFRVIHNKYDDNWIYGITFNIDWKNCDGFRDKYLSIHLGTHSILIGLICKYEGED